MATDPEIEQFKKLLNSARPGQLWGVKELPEIPQSCYDELDANPEPHRVVNLPGPIALPARPPSPKLEAMPDASTALAERMSLMSDTMTKATKDIVSRWYSCLEFFDPELPKEDYWNINSILKYVEIFYITLVQLSSGREGDGSYVTMSTLKYWHRIFVNCFGAYARDSTGARVGTRYMVTEGWMRRLEARIIWIGRLFELKRFPPKKTYLNQADIRAIFDYGFSTTELEGRLPFLETHLAVTIAFYTGVRTGSLGAGTVERRDRGEYIKLEDVTIQVVEPGLFDVEVSIKYKKGYNETANPGHYDIFRLQHVTKTHNLPFDVGLILMSLLFCRGALEGIETLEDMFAYDRQRVVIKKDKLNEPLFHSKTARGLHLANQAALNNGLLGPFMRMGRAIGLPVTNFHAMRRAAANIYGLVYGNEVARRVLSHAEGLTIYDRHYSKGVYNYDLTRARLGDLDSTVTVMNQNALSHQRNESMVVDAMLNTRIERVLEVDVKKRQQEHIASNEEHQLLTDLIDSAWDKLFGFLPTIYSLTYERQQGSLGFLFEAIKDIPQYIENKKLMDELSLNIRSLQDDRQKLERQLKKNVKRAAEREELKRFEEHSAQHTVEDRRQMKERLEKTKLMWEEQEKDPGGLEEAYKQHFYGVTFNKKMFQNPKLLNSFFHKDFINELRRPELFEILREQVKADAPYYVSLESIEDEDEDHEIVLASAIHVPPSPKPTESNDEDEFYQDGGPLETFSDKNDLPVFDVDRVKSGFHFVTRLVAPVFLAAALEKAKVNGVYECHLCKALGHLCKKVYSHKAQSAILRHQADVHDAWSHLQVYMLTDEETELICPSGRCEYSEPCDFKSEEVQDIYNHCLENCPNKARFKSIYDLCLHKTNPTAEGKNDKTQAKKRLRSLFMGELHLSRGSLNLFEYIENLDEKEAQEILDYAQSENVQIDYIEEKLGVLKQLVTIARQSIVGESKMKDEHAATPISQTFENVVTAEDHAYMDEERREAMFVAGQTIDLEDLVSSDSASEEEEEDLGWLFSSDEEPE